MLLAAVTSLAFDPPATANPNPDADPRKPDSSKHPGADRRPRPASLASASTPTVAPAIGRRRTPTGTGAHDRRRRQVLLGKHDANDLPRRRILHHPLMPVPARRLEGMRPRRHRDHIPGHPRGTLIIDGQQGPPRCAHFHVPALGVRLLHELVQLLGGPRVQPRGAGPALHFLKVHVRIGRSPRRQFRDGQAPHAIVRPRNRASLDILQASLLKIPLPVQSLGLGHALLGLGQVRALSRRRGGGSGGGAAQGGAKEQGGRSHRTFRARRR